MIKIYGNEGCTNCETVKTLLESQNIPFEYKYLNKIDPTEKFLIMKIAKDNRQMSLPVILINDEFISTNDFILKYTIQGE